MGLTKSFGLCDFDGDIDLSNFFPLIIHDFDFDQERPCEVRLLGSVVMEVNQDFSFCINLLLGKVDTQTFATGFGIGDLNC